MNQNDLNEKQQSASVPRVAPPIVKPPVVAPPIEKTVVTPPVIKTQADGNSSSDELSGTISAMPVDPIVPKVDVSQNVGEQSGSTIKQDIKESNLSDNIAMSVNDSNVPKINDLVRGQVKTNNLSEQIIEDKSETPDDETIIRNYMKKLKRRKIVKVCFSTVLVLTLIVLIIKFFPTRELKKEKNENEHISVIYDKDNYIAVKGDKGYGYINTKGKIMIPFQYKYAYDFYGDYALVETNDSTPKYNIIDLNGDVVQTTPFMPFYHVDYGVWEIENKLYNDNLELLSKKNQTVIYVSGEYFYYQDHEKDEYGLLDSKGKVVLNFSNEQSNLQLSTSEYSEKEVYVVLKDKDNNLNIVNLFNSKTVFTKYSDEVEIKHINNNVFKVLNKKDNTYKWIYIKNSEIAYETNEVLSNLNVYDYNNEILVADTKYGKYFYNIKTSEITNEPTTKSSATLYGYNIISKNNLMGLEKKGKKILDIKYTNIKFLDDTLFNYIKNDRGREFVLAIDYGKTYLIDVNENKTIATFNSINYILFKNTTFLRLDILNANGDLDHYIIYNLMTGQTLEVELTEDIHYGVNYISVSDGKKVRYYNNEFKKIYEERL